MGPGRGQGVPELHAPLLLHVLGLPGEAAASQQVNTAEASGVLRALRKAVQRLLETAFSCCQHLHVAWWMLYNQTLTAIIRASAFLDVYLQEKVLNAIGKDVDRLLAERKRVRMRSGSKIELLSREREREGEKEKNPTTQRSPTPAES